MKKLSLLLSILAVSALVALVYFYFEAAVHHAIDFIWNDWLDTETNRLLVVPLCFVLSLAFFGLQHYLDPRSEKHESHGLGDAPKPTFANLAKVLFIGFFSLVAGASLGPEAILVPASLLVGLIVGTRLFKKDEQAVKMLSMVGFIALFAAFFNSFIAGILGLVLVTKEVKTKLTPLLVAVAVIASLTTVYVLGLLDSAPFTATPQSTWRLNLEGVVASLALVAAGYGTVFLLGNAHAQFSKIREVIAKRAWWQHAVVAAIGLSALYLLGGPLVQFTGNQSIVPMAEESVSIGLVGLAGLFVTKVLAIGWSKALGYRGGMIFPSVFVASTLVMMAKIWDPQLSFIVGLIAVLIGMFAADRRVKILI